MNGASTGFPRLRELVSPPVLLICAALLVPHLMALGQPYFMDETAVLDNVMTFVGQKTIVPYHTKYPTLFSYLAAPFVLAGAALHWLTGGAGRPAEIVAWLYWEDPRGFIAPARLVSILALVAASAAVMRCGTRSSVDRRAGAVGACALLASPALLAYGSYGLPDATCMALSAAALAWSLRAMRHGGERRLPRVLVAASAAAGLAVSAKYTAASAFAPVGVAWLTWLAARRDDRPRRAARSAAALAGVGLGAFALGSPGWLLAPGRFLDGLRFELAHAAEGHLGAAGVPLLGQLELLVVGAPLLAIGGFAGVAFAFRAGHGDVRSAPPMPAAALIGATLAVAVISSKQSLHYMVPMLPALAWGLGRTTVAAERRAGRAGLVVVALLVALSAGASLRQAIHALAEPTDLAARRWIESELAPADRIALDMGYVPTLYDRERIAFLRGTKIGTAAPSTVDRIEATRTIFDEVEPMRHDAGWLESTSVDYLVTSEGCSERFFEFGVFTRRRPAPGSALSGEFGDRRRFYETLFASPRWTVAHRVPAGNGPEVTIYARSESRDGSGLR